MSVRGRLGALTRLAAMPGRLRISLLATVAALVLAGCGSGDDGTIPEENGNALLDVLDSLDADVSDGSCDSVPGLAEEFALRVEALPAEVDAEVKSELVDAAANLQDLSQDPPECADSGTTGEGGVEPVPEEDETTTEAPVEPAPDETTDDDQDEAEEPEEEADTPTRQPPDDGGESSGSQGGGSSESGGITGAFEE